MRATERETLADVFDALGNPKRIQMLEQLRTPRLAGELEIPQERDEPANISRQMVAKHLERLLDSGLVMRHDVARRGRDAVEFSLNHQALFQLSEAVRDLARMRPRVEPSLATTPRVTDARTPSKGPCLVAVRALEDGQTLSLSPANGPTEWTIGRRRDNALALDYDASVSSVHCRISWAGGRHVLEDAGSRNGTYLNFRRLDDRRPHALGHGDVLGLGRCLFVYWAA